MAGPSPLKSRPESCFVLNGSAQKRFSEDLRILAGQTQGRSEDPRLVAATGMSLVDAILPEFCKVYDSAVSTWNLHGHTLED